MFVKGTRIRARILYSWYANAEEPMAPDQIAAEFNLPVESVKEAIAYCEFNPPELAADYAAEEALMKGMGMNDPDYKYHPSPRRISTQELARLNS